MLQTGGKSVGQTQKTEQTGSAKIAYRLAQGIRNMNVGDTFTGKVTNLDGQALELMLADKSTLSAKLSQRMNINVGQTMSFEISSNSGGKVQLTPLYANLAGDSQITKALMGAELPVNPENAEMVQSMMEEGMKIDAGSLLEMAKTVNSNPDAAPSTIVQMTKLGIPITEENAVQFELYKNNSHQIASEISQLAEGYSDLAKTGIAVNNEILNIFTGPVDEGTVQLLQSAVKENTGNPAADMADINDGAVIQTEEGNTGNGAKNVIAGQDKPSRTEGIKEGGEILYGKNAVTENLGKLFSEDERNALAGRLEELGVPKSLTSNVRSADITSSQTLDLIKAAIDEFSKTSENKEQFKDSLKNLIESNEYGKLLKNEITGKMLLSPEDVADKEKIKEYFERIVRDTTKMSQLLNNTGRGDTTLAKETENLRQNVDFLNQLNQTFTYIQLPLKLNDQSAHGDLYVYTNKKKLASKDGNVSALLHLDMEHLGTMDVHVSMNQESNVTTHFIMQKAELLDFIAEHLPELDDRLNKRGYKVKSDVALNREAKSVPEIMFNTGRSEKLIQKLTFDVKA